MHYTWHDWHKSFEKTKRNLINQGFEVIDIVFELDELTQYCKLRHCSNINYIYDS